jgi:hypothetical protein
VIVTDTSADPYFLNSVHKLDDYSDSDRGLANSSSELHGEYLWSDRTSALDGAALTTSDFTEQHYSDIHDNAEIYTPFDVGSGGGDPTWEDEDLEDEDFGGAIMDFTSSALEVEDQLRRRQEASSKDDPLRSYSASVDAIYAAVYTSGGATNYAVALILNSFHQLHSFRPCRHFMQGHCFRKDCAFSHEFSSVPCRYWLLEGPGCSNGDSCSFLHWVPDLDMNSSFYQDDSAPPLVVDDIDEFPSLAPIPKGKTLGDTKTAPAILPNSLVKKPAPEQSARGQGTIASASTMSSKVSSGAAYSSNAEVSSETFGAHEWVASGRSVKATYETHRAAAKQLASSRNKLLQEATNAYMRYIFLYFVFVLRCRCTSGSTRIIFTYLSLAETKI